MSEEAPYGERGGITTLRAASALQSSHDFSTPSSLSKNSNTSQHRNANTRPQQSSASIRQQMTLTSRERNGDAPRGRDEDKSRDFQSSFGSPSADAAARTDLLKDAVFPTWKDDVGSDTIEGPEELQKKDPLGTQIWKLYSRTKTRLPNQERMENLTWRMMAMNLKRLEREQALYDHLSTVDLATALTICLELRRNLLRWEGLPLLNHTLARVESHSNCEKRPTRR